MEELYKAPESSSQLMGMLSDTEKKLVDMYARTIQQYYKNDERFIKEYEFVNEQFLLEKLKRILKHYLKLEFPYDEDDKILGRVFFNLPDNDEVRRYLKEVVGETIYDNHFKHKKFLSIWNVFIYVYDDLEKIKMIIALKLLHLFESVAVWPEKLNPKFVKNLNQYNRIRTLSKPSKEMFGGMLNAI
jgi:hypothetical protein